MIFVREGFFVAHFENPQIYVGADRCLVDNIERQHRLKVGRRETRRLGVVGVQ